MSRIKHEPRKRGNKIEEKKELTNRELLAQQKREKFTEALYSNKENVHISAANILDYFTFLVEEKQYVYLSQYLVRLVFIGNQNQFELAFDHLLEIARKNQDDILIRNIIVSLSALKHQDVDQELNLISFLLNKCQECSDNLVLDTLLNDIIDKKLFNIDQLIAIIANFLNDESKDQNKSKVLISQLADMHVISIKKTLDSIVIIRDEGFKDKQQQIDVLLELATKYKELFLKSLINCHGKLFLTMDSDDMVVGNRESFITIIAKSIKENFVSSEVIPNLKNNRRCGFARSFKVYNGVEEKTESHVQKLMHSELERSSKLHTSAKNKLGSFTIMPKVTDDSSIDEEDIFWQKLVSKLGVVKTTNISRL